MCARVGREGWLGQPGSHCRRCHRSWVSLVEGHCSLCCAHFTSVGAFDLHVTAVGCVPPGSVRWRSGVRKGLAKLKVVERKSGPTWCRAEEREWGG